MRNPPCENRIDPIAQPIMTYSKVLISEEQIPVDPAVAAKEVELMVVVEFGCGECPARTRCRDNKSGPTGYSCVARLHPKPAFPDSFSTDPSKHTVQI